MASFGNTGTPGSGWAFLGSGYAVATQFTAPATGALVTNLHGFFDANSGSPTGYLVMWDTAGNVLASANVGTLAVGTQSNGGQQWYTAAVTPVSLTPSQVVWLGFIGSSNILFSSESGGSSYQVAMSSPNSFTGYASTGIGGVGAYADYTTGGIWLNTGTSASPVWVNGQVALNTGTSASPVWVISASGVALNTGTPSSPVWVTGA